MQGNNQSFKQVRELGSNKKVKIYTMELSFSYNTRDPILLTDMLGIHI